MVLESSIPVQPARVGSSFVEFARRFGDFAIVGVAASLLASDDEIADARIALTGVGDKPWRKRKLEEVLIGKKAAPDLFSKVASEVAASISPGAKYHSGIRRRDDRELVVSSWDDSANSESDARRPFARCRNIQDCRRTRIDRRHNFVKSVLSPRCFVQVENHS
jgi:xanthine dehydrogenase iron-sulfur cluster and FAD-binding subunit A